MYLFIAIAFYHNFHLEIYDSTITFLLKWCDTKLPFLCITWQVPYPHYTLAHYLKTLRPRKNGRHFTGDIFKCIFLNENIWIPIKFHRNVLLRVQLATFRHYLKRWELVYRRIYASLRLTESKWMNLRGLKLALYYISVIKYSPFRVSNWYTPCVAHGYDIVDNDWIDMLKPRQNAHYFPDDIIKCIFVHEKSLNFVENVTELCSYVSK